jgi:two-component system, OmpR family, sensor kinase
MFRSLYSRLAAVLTGLFFLVGLSFVAVLVFSMGMYQQEVNQRLNSKLAQQIVAEEIPLEKNRINEQALKAVFHKLMVVNPSIELYLLDPKGNILAYSAPKEKIKQKAVDLAPIVKWISGDMSTPLKGDDPRHPGEKKAFSAARIPAKGTLEGYLYVILGGEIYQSVAQKLMGSYVLRLSAGLVGAGLLFAFLAGLILFFVLTGRLRRLAGVIDAFKKGDDFRKIDLRVKKGAHHLNEIDRLGTAFMEMAGRIEDQIEQLQNSDALRRELIANVSHDLRTPLATLQGYIETLLMKEDGLTPEERRRYLEIAARHCERLTRLVNELLELARLESFDETRIEREPFSLGELIQDVARKFQLAADEKGIHIVTNIQEKLPFVNADIGLIERTLENLLENAVRYTPEGGSISLLMKPEDEDIAVEVRDTGPGIPEEEVPRIFNRFYQSEKSRDGAEGHSGLGLAITRRILELHNRSIEVSGGPGKGTSFIFRLPKHHPSP